MISHRVVVAAGLAGALMLPLAAVHAQTSLGNKSVPGVCMLSRTEVLANSKVGHAADARLKQLATQANDQLKQERDPLSHDIQQFRERAKSMTPSERQSQQQALQKRMQAFQQKTQELDARIRLTRSRAMARIGKVIDPLVASAYQQRGCGILLDRDTVLGGNQGNDLTPAAIEALDKKMTTISFSLAPLPKPSSGNGK